MTESWGVPDNLGSVINSSSFESRPSLSRDGHWLFFSSNRTGGFSPGLDIWASYREHVHDDFGWQPPFNLGPGVNSAGSSEVEASYVENDDGGVPLLFFASNRAFGFGGFDIYVSELLADGTWGAATWVPDLSSSVPDQSIAVRFDGLEAFLAKGVAPVGLLFALTCLPALGFATADASTTRNLDVPIGLDRYVPAPHDNPITPEKVALGRRLFFDTKLSGDGRTSCATCHQPRRRFTDGRSLARGVFGREGQRNTPSILNRAYGLSAFRDGRADTLEDQVRAAITGERDLGLSMQEAEAILLRDADREGDRHVRSHAVVGRQSVRPLPDKDATALNTVERRGLELFSGRARCARCHAGPLLSDEAFHNTGIAWRDGRFLDPGRTAMTGSDRDRGAFKTPSLREVTRTAPYMHDGSVARLTDVIEFYDRGGRPNPNLDLDIRSLNLSSAEKAVLLAFLRALNGTVPGS